MQLLSIVRLENVLYNIDFFLAKREDQSFNTESSVVLMNTVKRKLEPVRFEELCARSEKVCMI